MNANNTQTSTGWKDMPRAQKRIWKGLILLCVINILAQLALLPQLPARMPIHWNTAGNVDGWGSPLVQAALAALPLLLLGLLYACPRMDPRGANFKSFGGLWIGFVLAFTLFMLLVSWLPIATVFGLLPQKGSPVGVLICTALGTIFIALGNYMPRIRQNYSFGCRTPWALADANNWRLTHRFAGRTFVVMGAALIVSGIVSTRLPDLALALVLVPVFAGTGATFLYSYLVFRKGNQPLRS